MLANKGPMAFGEMRRDLGTKSSSSVSYALRKLGPLTVRNKERKYEITASGRLCLQIDQLTRWVEDGAKPTYEEKMESISIIEAPEPFLEQNNKTKVDIALIGSADLNLRKMFDTVRFEISTLSSLLLYRFADEIGRQKGLQRPSLGALSPGYDTLRWIKDAYDFETVLMFHLDPKKLIESLDWPKIFETSRRKDAQYAEGLQIVKQRMQREKKRILRDHLTEELNRTSELAKDYITKTFDESQNPDVLVGHSQEEVANRLAERIEGMLSSAPFHATRREIRALLDENLRQKFSIVPKTLYVIEKHAGA